MLAYWDSPETFSPTNHACSLNRADRPHRDRRLLRIQLHDQIFVDIGQHFVASRWRLEHAAKFLIADFDPLRKADLGGHGKRGLDPELLARLLANLDHISRL